MEKILLYDTTLRDGRQGAGISFSMVDLLNVTKKLDAFGMDYIEAGWPGSNPKDVEFFQKLSQMEFQHAKIVAFGSTRHAKNKPSEDPLLRALVESKAPVITIFGKTWDMHVEKVFGITEQQNVDMIADSIEYLKNQGVQVFFDGEHFFDGYKENPEFAMRMITVAAKAGADSICLCETNGGMLPGDITRIVTEVRKELQLPMSIHCHNDSDCAVANSLAAVEAGITQVQGTINGIGERTGNANLCSIIPNLGLKMGYEFYSSDHDIAKLTELSRYVSEMANLPHNEALPYVGANAFAHKAGVHVNAVEKDSRTYEHIKPETVGNKRTILISDYSGTSSVMAKAREFSVEFGDKAVPKKVVELVKQLENEGYQFEGADASFELLIKQAMGQFEPAFQFKGFRIITQRDEKGATVNEATIKVIVDGKEELAVAEGDGPIDALDHALRKVLEIFYPHLKDMKLVDFKVRILDSKMATAAKTRVVIESQCGKDIWGTVGVSENIIEASWKALVDSIEYLLMKYPESCDIG